MIDVEQALVRAICGVGEQEPQARDAMLDALFYIRRWRWGRVNRLRGTREKEVRHGQKG